MPWLRLLPAALALLVLAAHFYRAGLVFLVPVCIGFLVLLSIRLAWVPRAVAVALLIAAAEWLRTLVMLAGERIDAGQPHARLVAILAGVTAATLLAAWPLRTEAVRRWFAADGR
jgi:hypothetical protein